VVLPERPNAQEIESYLDMMGRISSLSGYPPVRMALVRASETARVGDRDLLIIGTIGHLQGAADLLKSGPLGIAGGRLSVSFPAQLESVRRLFVGEESADRQRVASALQASTSESVSALVGFESPYNSHRSVVVLLAGSGETLETAVASVRDSETSAFVQGDLSILTTGKVTSYRVSQTYTVGSLPFWLWPSYLLRDQAYMVVVLMLAGAVLCGTALFWLMRRRVHSRLTPTTPPGRNVI
jgi:cellulose synthase (UDP-forming)